ncbi:hypothetical protein ACSBR1_026821 [Camellia fascicularis]
MQSRKGEERERDEPEVKTMTGKMAGKRRKRRTRRIMLPPLNQVAGVSCSCQHSRFEVETLVMKIYSLNCM